MSDLVPPIPVPPPYSPPDGIPEAPTVTTPEVAAPPANPVGQVTDDAGPVTAEVATNEHGALMAQGTTTWDTPLPAGVTL